MDAVHLDRRLSPVVNGQHVLPGVLTYLRAGAGYGGSCFPKDIFALRMFARELAAPVPLLDAVTEVNERRPKEIAARLAHVLGPLAGQTIAIIGLAFKPGTDDLRCSPALEIIKHLQAAGAEVRAFDPVAMPAAAQLASPQFALCATPEELVEGADAAAIATAWPEVGNWDWARLAMRMRRPWIMDLRNAFRRVAWPTPIRYMPIGVAADSGENE
jgi:UDPglucose 6-dehydrogenase